jgi:UDP-N-acetyl-D-mannosaminuronate dehydrogenase
VIVFIVPVDVDAEHRPDFAMLDAAVDALAPHVARGALVIVETTVPVGTTRQRVGGRIERATGMRPGADFALAFSPERVLRHGARDLQRLPRSWAASTRQHRAARFYASVLDAEVVAMSIAEAAEFSKLADTTYRDVNIALANEFAAAADRLGIDVRR